MMTTSAKTTSPKTTSPYRSKLHRDGSVTIWDVYDQSWTRQTALSGEQWASLDQAERTRIERHMARHADALRDVRSDDDDEVS